MNLPLISGFFDERTEVLERYRRHVNVGLGKMGEVMALPLEVSSDGCLVCDEKGQEFLDCGGYGVFLLGHRHPKVIESVKAQLDTHPLATRTFMSPKLAEGAKRLADISPAGLNYTFFTNSGTEATELGLKLARLNGKSRIISMTGGFHGKTMGALSVTGRNLYQAPFWPLVPGVEFADYGDASSLKKLMGGQGKDCCVILEPVQGEAGVIIPPSGYLKLVEEICRNSGAMLIIDEIQTGMGRLGTWWGAELDEVLPDVMLVGKGLSGGVVPVGAVVATEEAFAKINKDPLLHSSTFAGNPLAVSAAISAIDTIEEEDILDKSKVLGAKLLFAIREILERNCPRLVKQVRGRGLLIGVEFYKSHLAGDFMLEMIKRRVILSHSLNSNKVVRFTPPAIMTEDQFAWLMDSVKESSRELSNRWENTKENKT